MLMVVLTGCLCLFGAFGCGGDDEGAKGDWYDTCLGDSQCKSGLYCERDLWVDNYCTMGYEGFCTSECESTSECQQWFGADSICSFHKCVEYCNYDYDCTGEAFCLTPL